MTVDKITPRGLQHMDQGYWSKLLHQTLIDFDRRLGRLETLINSQIAPAAAVDTPHNTADSRRITSPDAVDLATAITLANEMKTKLNAHEADDDVHASADATNTVSSADATDQSSLNTLLNEIKGDIVAHGANDTAHNVAHSITVSAANASDLATSLTLVNELKDDVNSHFADSTSKGVDTALEVNYLVEA